MRAYRPSEFGLEDAAAYERIKQEHVMRYAQRVEAGLAVFDESPPSAGEAPPPDSRSQQPETHLCK